MLANFSHRILVASMLILNIGESSKTNADIGYWWIFQKTSLPGYWWQANRSGGFGELPSYGPGGLMMIGWWLDDDRMMVDGGWMVIGWWMNDKRMMIELWWVTMLGWWWMMIGWIMIRWWLNDCWEGPLWLSRRDEDSQSWHEIMYLVIISFTYAPRVPLNRWKGTNTDWFQCFK